MAERVQERDRLNIPNSPECGKWETLLVDAMDGLLLPEDEAFFSDHMATCGLCTDMFEQVRRGREWLDFLSPEPQAPLYLLDRILIETGKSKIDPGKLQVAGGALDAAGGIGNVVGTPQVWQRAGFSAGLRRFAEPRLLMTAAMAFFSIALTLSMTGVKITGIKMADLKPASVRLVVEKRIMTASTPIVRYYDHLRFVYEVESRMRELRRSTDSEQKPAQGSEQREQPASPDGETHRKDGGSQLHPNDAPQQTVNPPAMLWGTEPLEADLPLKANGEDEGDGPADTVSRQSDRPADRTTSPVNFRVASGYLIDGSVGDGAARTLAMSGGLEKAGSSRTEVLAMPDRSTSWLA